MNNWLWRPRSCLIGLKTPWFRLCTSCSILNQRSRTFLADFLFFTFASLVITSLYFRTCIILSTDRDLSTVYSILAVKHIGAIQIDIGCIDIFNHIWSKFLIIIRHGQWLWKIVLLIFLLFMIFIHLFLHWINLSLYIIERPLLRLLHLNHHLLDLFKLLEAIRLHFL